MHSKRESFMYSKRESLSFIFMLCALAMFILCHISNYHPLPGAWKYDPYIRNFEYCDDLQLRAIEETNIFSDNFDLRFIRGKVYKFKF